MKLIQFFILITALSQAQLTFAAETDNFTGRNQEIAALRDSLPQLDAFTNQRLREAIELTNRQGGCSTSRLFRNVWTHLGRNPIGEVENFAELDPGIDRYLVDFKKSIYAKVPTFMDEHRAPRLADLFILSGFFAATIRLNGQVIGIDKLGHFFGQGLLYYQTGSLKRALELGIADEEGLDGYIGSGVYSYGDLSANADGLRFWSSLVDGDDPYVRCRNGEYVQNRAFTWMDYVSPAWDEALNCSKFVSTTMKQAVDSSIAALGMSCPVSPSACKQMIDSHPCSALTVSPACFAAANINRDDKKLECDALLAISNWEDSARKSMNRWNSFLMTADTTLGIAGLSFHFMLRDYKLHAREAANAHALKDSASSRVGFYLPQETKKDTSRELLDTQR